MCFVFLAISFGLIIINIFKTVGYNKLKKEEKKDYIKFIEDDKLPQFNVKLFSALNEQKASYITSLVSISFSLFSLINYTVTNKGLNCVLFLFSLIVAIPCLVCFVAPSYFLSHIPNRRGLTTSNENIEQHKFDRDLVKSK